MKKLITLLLIIVLSLSTICVFAEDADTQSEETEGETDGRRYVYNLLSDTTTAFWAGSGSKLTSSGENYVSARFNFSSSFSGIYFRCIWASDTAKGALGECEFSIYKYKKGLTWGSDYEVKDALYSSTFEIDGNTSNVIYNFDELPAGEYVIRLKQSNEIGYLVFPGGIHTDGDADEGLFDYDVDSEHLHRVSGDSTAVAFAVLTNDENGTFAKLGTTYGDEPTEEPTDEPTVTDAPEEATDAPSEPTEEPAKATDEPSKSTNEPTATEAPKTSGGCGGVISAGAIGMLLLGVALLKKKHE